MVFPSVFSLMTSLAALNGSTDASTAPTLPDFMLVWADTFGGEAGSAPSTVNWIHETGAQSNDEIETYTTTTDNCYLTGEGSLQIVPLLSDTGEWTSCRLESKEQFTCAEGGMMVMQALIKLGSNAGIGDHQGIWPAFWALGASILHGTQWPECGEWDIMENINADALGYGTLHCADACDGSTGLTAGVDFTYDEFHTWALAVDRTNSDWTQQELRWYLDGVLYHTITGSDLGNQTDWATVTADPFFIILNVAVGGDWPGDPDSATADGVASGMEVQYVGVYASTNT